MPQVLAQVLELEDGRAAVFQRHVGEAVLHILDGPVDLVDADGPAFVLGRERVVAPAEPLAVAPGVDVRHYRSRF